MIGMMSAVIIAAKQALSFLPNIELATLLIILYTIVFGNKTIYTICIFVISQGLLYGFNIWFVPYMYIWFILYLIALMFKKHRSPLLWAIVSGAFGLSFGALCAIVTIVVSGFNAGFAFWIAGIPFDLVHGVANFAITLVLFTPLYYILNKINTLTYTD